MSRSTIMFAIGVAMAVGAAAGMMWASVDAAPLIVIVIVGVVFIGVGARDRRSQ